MTTLMQFPDQLDIWQDHHAAPIPPKEVRRWVSHMTAICRPARIYWCNGSAAECAKLIRHAEDDRAFQSLNTAPGDEDPEPVIDLFRMASRKTEPLFRECMRGRTMYVVPVALGPMGDPAARIAVQLTDSVRVAASLSSILCTGDPVWKQLARTGSFTQFLHSMGNETSKRRRIFHFPADHAVWSVGSGY
jgi:phosphoenolpyruvate carboxykinase (GTP)